MYCLDTNTIVFHLRGRASNVTLRLLQLTPEEVVVPSQVMAELIFGATKSIQSEKRLREVKTFLAPFKILWPNEQSLRHYVEVRFHLESQGIPISEADLWIAATALSEQAVLVTHNTREFARVPDLLIEDWT